MLKSIKTTMCPVCGCGEIVEESIQTSNYNKPEVLRHCNGARWEHRKFLCGYRVQYEPNFSKEVESKNSECCYNPEVITRKEKEKQDKRNVIDLLESNNISQVIIDRVKMHCLY